MNGAVPPMTTACQVTGVGELKEAVFGEAVQEIVGAEAPVEVVAPIVTSGRQSICAVWAFAPLVVTITLAAFVPLVV